jgi:Fur family peroxide stress response transcriptional regulator
MVKATMETPRDQELIDRIHDTGYRLTPQRLALIRLLADDCSHPTAEQVYTRLRQEFPTVSLATVYNTLEMLVALGEALPLDLQEGVTRYDVRRPTAHGHVICRHCGRVEDVELTEVPNLLRATGDQTGFGDVRPRIAFDGVCPDCRPADPG